MRILYFDCIAGASGDMILGALIDAGVDADWLRRELGKLPIANWKLETRAVEKNGFGATKVDVIVDRQPHSRPLPEIERVIDQSGFNDAIKAGARAVIRMIAAEEARIHRRPIEQVHLHEVGGEDAMIDIIGALLAIEHLGIESVITSALPLGRGFIQGAHGHIPLPAPATVALLKGARVVGSPVAAELVTPTGAALLKHLTNSFGELPALRLDAVGYGAGTIDLDIPNLLRVFIGEADLLPAGQDVDTVCVLETNIDDQNPEHYEHVIERMFAAGALDVTLTPTQMKKNRPGVALTVLTSPTDKDVVRDLIFAETSSFGVREQLIRRRTLPREIVQVETEFGQTKVKVGHLPHGMHKYAPEFEDCRMLARKVGVPLRDVYVAAEIAARALYESADEPSPRMRCKT